MALAKIVIDKTTANKTSPYSPIQTESRAVFEDSRPVCNTLVLFVESTLNVGKFPQSPDEMVSSDSDEADNKPLSNAQVQPGQESPKPKPPCASMRKSNQGAKV